MTRDGGWRPLVRATGGRLKAQLQRNWRLGMMRTIGRKNFVELWKLLQHNSVKIFWVLDSVWGGSKSSCHKIKWIMNEVLRSVMNCFNWMSELFISLLGYWRYCNKKNFLLECWVRRAEWCGPGVLWPAELASLRDEPISDHSPSLLLPVTVRNTIICALTHTKTDSKWKRFVLLVGHRKKSGLDYRPMQWKVPSIMGFLHKSLLTKKSSAVRKISFEGNYYWTTCSQHKKCNSSQKVENV